MARQLKHWNTIGECHGNECVSRSTQHHLCGAKQSKIGAAFVCAGGGAIVAGLSPGTRNTRSREKRPGPQRSSATCFWKHRTRHGCQPPLGNDFVAGDVKVFRSFADVRCGRISDDSMSFVRSNWFWYYTYVFSFRFSETRPRFGFKVCLPLKMTITI